MNLYEAVSTLSLAERLYIPPHLFLAVQEGRKREVKRQPSAAAQKKKAAHLARI